MTDEIPFASRDVGVRRTVRLIHRGIRRRCPNCGARDIFATWFRTHASCDACGLLLDRGEEDFFLGAYTVNFVTAELLLVAFLALVVVVTAPDVPWGFIQYGGIALMIIAPLLFFPFSRTLWLAIDLSIRPATRAGFASGPGRPDAAPGGRGTGDAGFA